MNKPITLLFKSLLSPFIIFSFLAINSHADDNDLIPLEHFACASTRPTFSISPDGKHMLIGNTIKDNICDIEQDYSKRVEDNFRDRGLILVNLDTNESKSISKGKGKDRISQFGWLNNNRIWYTPRLEQGKTKLSTFAMNLDGSKVKELWEYSDSYTTPYDMAYNEPNYIYVLNNGRRDRVFDYYKLNVYTGSKKLMAFGPNISDMRGVAELNSLHHLDGTPLSVTFDHGLNRITYLYDQEKKEWVEHFEFNCQEPGFMPVGMYGDKMVVAGSKFSPDGALIEENDTNAIYLYDYKTREFGQKLYQDPNYDAAGLTGSCRTSSGYAVSDKLTGETAGIFYESLSPEKVFFDKDLETKYLTVKSVFPDHHIDIVTASVDRNRMMIQKWDTDEPGEYFYVDLTKGIVEPFFKISPWLDRSKLSKAKKVVYTARDGLKIPALLTLTKQRTDKNYFIVLPHGGPNTKQYIKYDSWAQFFVSRGINVLQMDFRGSTGLGANHYMAGNQEWGKKMQDDISDGVAWAIENGYADPDRVCIAGASYGGYATMAGLVFTPDLYRCGINAIGVTDQMQILENFANRASRDQSWDKEPLLEWGDISTEEGYAYAQASSPVNFVKNIKAAVLVLHGSNDRVVEPRHAEDLIDQLKDYNIEYMSMFQAKEGHCVTYCGERASLEYMQIQEEFLERYLKD